MNAQHTTTTDTTTTPTGTGVTFMGASYDEDGYGPLAAPGPAHRWSHPQPRTTPEPKVGAE